MHRNESYKEYVENVSPQKRDDHSLWKVTKKFKRPLTALPLRPTMGDPVPTSEKVEMFAKHAVHSTPAESFETEKQISSKLNDKKNSEVNILGLFELTTLEGDRPEGFSELEAAKLAVKHVNERHILGNFTLKLLTNDTKCDPGVGVDRFFHALYTRPLIRMPILLGSACSEVTESLAKVVPYWNMVQVSFGSTSPVLSDRKEYPLFYRTAAPDTSHNPARIAFVRRFRWDTVTALSQNEDVYSLAINDLVTELEEANISCLATVTFSESNLMDQLKLLRDLDTRIIIGSFSEKVAPKIFCAAHRLGMYGADYVWILQAQVGGKRNSWWQEPQKECSSTQLADAVEGLILVTSHNGIVGDMPSISGLSNDGFLKSLQYPLSQFAHQAYDAVWAIALALRGAGIHLPLYDYTRTDMANCFFCRLGHLSFIGVSGPVEFNGADRVGITAFYQVQGGHATRIALYDPSLDNLNFTCPSCGSIIWRGGQVPIAKRIFKLRIVTIHHAAFLLISCLASVGITLAIVFLAFNLHFRRLKYIKLSSPRLNNMAVVGCILVYTAVILLGLDHATLPSKTAFPTVCTARVYLLSAGFSLAFGSMFTKTYRVHRIFTRSSSGVVKNKLLQDTQLISLICVLLLIDGLIVTLWVVFDPMQRHLRNLTLEISTTDRSVVYQPQVEVCGSQFTHSWLGALYVYKGLLLIVGVYMAWETRHVKIPALNDSHYIGMSVYSVVITSALVVVLANLISERATLAFLTITILILVSTTSSLCLLFLPKIHTIFSHSDCATDPIMQSMGLKIEFNTRRFLMDDKREVYYRVEVQNRVYRRDLMSLDTEISRLERQLINNPTSPTSSHSSYRTDRTPIEDTGANMIPVLPPARGKSPSVGGGLPLLLLSVLPPVIPRASWPSAEHCVTPMRRGVTFSSEPKLDENSVQTKPHTDEEDEYYRRQEGSISLNEPSKISVFRKLRSMLQSKPTNRKSSSSSTTAATGGIAAALKVHMGYFSGLVPANKSGSESPESSCNTSRLGISKDQKYNENLSGNESDSRSFRKFSLAALCKSSNDDDSIQSDSEEASDEQENNQKIQAQSVPSLSQRVSFSIQHQHSQPVLNFREKARGSPRFPHRIVPTSSLNALEDRRKSSSAGCGVDTSFNRRRSQVQILPKQAVTQLKIQESNNVVEKCRSLEDTSSEISPSKENRARSLNLNYDIWPKTDIELIVHNSSGNTRQVNGDDNLQTTEIDIES
ncbi:gamma-aminobutyric acid type B receptor subunit 3 [Lycorma delicatula]|uniref:gamma-aminobutyric acid type B receptor subunit 3 n=1 Tax=Lycorma delicatula TaxID=130591 RepID=UPI003F51578A